LTLSFPNHSRSYDETGRRIRFSGYDGMFEIRFFIEIDALNRVFSGKAANENEYLSTFDTGRNAILDAAKKAYGRGRAATICTLSVADFA
jgi:hypothetical protein